MDELIDLIIDLLGDLGDLSDEVEDLVDALTPLLEFIEDLGGSLEYLATFFSGISSPELFLESLWNIMLYYVYYVIAFGFWGFAVISLRTAEQIYRFQKALVEGVLLTGGMEIITSFLTADVYRNLIAVAIMLFAISWWLRPLFRIELVNFKRMVLYAAIAGAFVHKGPAISKGLEDIRWEVAYAIQERVTAGIAMHHDVIIGDISDPADVGLLAPGDLDAPLDGQKNAWEIIATSYYMVESRNQLVVSEMPPRFVDAFFDPDDIIYLFALNPIDPVGAQVERERVMKAAQVGCGRMVAGGMLPIYGITEAVVMALFALAGAFILLMVPFALLFSFFVYTESVMTQLVHSYINLFIRTMVATAIMGIFLAAFQDVASSNGTVPFQVMGFVGIFVSMYIGKMAMGTLTETVSQTTTALSASFGQLSGVDPKREVERTVGGAADVATGTVQAGVGAAMIATGVGGPMGVGMLTGGMGKMMGGAGAMTGMDETGRPPDGVSRAMRYAGMAVSRQMGREEGKDFMEATADYQMGEDMSISGWAAMNIARRFVPGRQEAGRGGRLGAGREWSSDDIDVPPPEHEGERREMPRMFAARTHQQEAEAWASRHYGSPSVSGQRQVAQGSRETFGEEVARGFAEVLNAHSRKDVAAALNEMRSMTAEMRGAAGRHPFGEFYDPDTGDVSAQSRGALELRERLPRGSGFTDGELESVIRAGMNVQAQAGVDEIGRALGQVVEQNREIMQRAEGEGEHPVAALRGAEPAANRVAGQLGLDPAATGSHFGALNAFAADAAMAGLSAEQARQLVVEVHSDDGLSDGLAEELKDAIARGGSPVRVEDLERGARALPGAIVGPTAGGRLAPEIVAQARGESPRAEDIPPTVVVDSPEIDPTGVPANADVPPADDVLQKGGD